MTTITSGAIGPRWTPAPDPAAAGTVPAERPRPGTAHRERMRPGPDGGHAVVGADAGARERLPAPALPVGAAPDPSGNAGRRLDAFA